MDFAYIKCVLLLLVPLCLGQDKPNNPDFEVTITPAQSPSLLAVGNGISFFCSSSTTKDGRTPVLSWAFNGKAVADDTTFPGITLQKVGVNDALIISDATEAHEGFYTCFGKLDGQESKAEVEVQITKALKIESPTNQFGILGQDGKVMCKATGNPPPTVLWKFANKTAIVSNEKYVIMSTELLIKDLVLADTQDFLCDAFVIVTGAHKTLKVNYQVAKVPTIELPPTISPDNPTVGDKVEIKCIADGVPKPTYSFKKGDAIMPDSQVNKATGVMTIDELQKSDEAEYTCIASNLAGSIQKSNKLDVMIKPTIEDIPNIGDAAEDSTLDIICKAEGDPVPEVSWKKKDMQIEYQDGENQDGPTIEVKMQGSPDDDVKKRDATMTFKPVKYNNGGTYICTAKNAVGESSKEMNLEVMYKPHFDTDYKTTVFYGWNDHDTNLTCQASGNPVPNIFWKRMNPDTNKLEDVKGQPGMNVKDGVTYPEGNLRSRSLVVTISGEDATRYADYTCIAHNILGNASQTVKLKQAYVPGKPTVNLKQSYPTMLVLRIKKPANDGGQSVTKFEYAHSLTDGGTSEYTEKEATGDETEIRVNNLKASTNYVVSVKAGNDVGFGIAEQVSIETMEVSVPMKVEIKSDHVGDDDDTFTLEWAMPGSGGSPILKYLIKYRKVEVAPNANPDLWRVTNDVDKESKEQVIEGAAKTRLVLKDLSKDTYYDVRIFAINKEGSSPEQSFILKTGTGGDDVSGTGNDGGGKTSAEGKSGGDGEEVDNNTSDTGGSHRVEESKADSSTDSSSSLSAGLGTAFFVLLTACFSAL